MGIRLTLLIAHNGCNIFKGYLTHAFAFNILLVIGYFCFKFNTLKFISYVRIYY